MALERGQGPLGGSFSPRRAGLASRLWRCAACSLLGVVLAIGRVAWSGNRIHLYLIWNLFLAWIPAALSLGVVLLRGRGARGWLLLLSAAWLVFFPNAPYLVTDFIHLHPLPPVPLLYDVALFWVFAWTGMTLAFHSLGDMQRLVEEARGRRAGWAFAVACLGLSAVGVYLGRVERWNSWDVLDEPDRILADVSGLLGHPRGNARALGFIALYAVVLLVTYAAFRPGQGRRAPRSACGRAPPGPPRRPGAHRG